VTSEAKEEPGFLSGDKTLHAIGNKELSGERGRNRWREKGKETPWGAIGLSRFAFERAMLVRARPGLGVVQIRHASVKLYA
jgi:hypothetical protein